MLLAAIAGWLPSVITILATVLGCIWYGLQIWDSSIVRGWRGLPIPIWVPMMQSIEATTSVHTTTTTHTEETTHDPANPTS